MRAIDIGGSSRYLCELRVCERHDLCDQCKERVVGVTVSVINVRKARQCHGVCDQCKERADSVTVSDQCKERVAVSRCLISVRKERQCHGV